MGSGQWGQVLKNQFFVLWRPYRPLYFPLYIILATSSLLSSFTEHRQTLPCQIQLSFSLDFNKLQELQEFYQREDKYLLLNQWEFLFPLYCRQKLRDIFVYN